MKPVPLSTETSTHEDKLVEMNSSFEAPDRTRELLESEYRFVSLMACSPVGIFQTNAKGDRVYLNERYCKILDLTPEQAQGSCWTIGLHPEDRQRVLDSWQHTIETGAEFLMEYRLLTPSGQLRWVLTNAVCLRDALGLVTGFVGSVMDITEQKKLEMQVRQSQKMDSIGRLAGGIAHDFNNLITIILGNAELARSELPAECEVLAECIQSISDAGARAAALTKQLLAFSRKQMLELKPLNVNSIVYGLQKMLPRLIGEDIKLLTRLAPNAWQVMADPGQIEQIIMNLVVNARDAMPRGGTLRIETSNVAFDGDAHRHAQVKPGAYLKLSVVDSGCGIAPDTLQMVFEPFFTTKQPGEGTGMGLATVFGIVSQSNGYVTVESELGHGATFNVYLPRWEGSCKTQELAPADSSLAPGSGTILLVEDEDDVRHLTRRILETAGYQVVEAGSGFQGLQLAIDCLPSIDLLITDVVMPSVSGHQLAEQLTKVRPDLNVLFLSGYTHDVISPELLSERGFDFLPKPFTAESLTLKVQQVLLNRQNPPVTAV